MARTTSEAVALICEVDTNISLLPFIEAASAIVTKQCIDTSFTTEELELIERWLSAHFYKMRELQISSEHAGRVSQSFQSQLNLGFDNSTYGQMAMRLDWSGALAALNEQSKEGIKNVLGLSWLGLTEDEIESTWEI